jgi:hypothetical protein
MSSEGFPTTEERRSSTRFRKEPGWDLATVHCPDGGSIPTDVHDESLGGISVYLPDLYNLSIGQEVDITFEGATRRARLRHIEPQDKGGFILGFQCAIATKS